MGLKIRPDTFIAQVCTREEEEEEDLSSDGVSLKGSKEAMAKTDDQDLEMERERGSQRQHDTAKAWQLDSPEYTRSCVELERKGWVEIWPKLLPLTP